jgi:hypothetical protein
MQGRPVQMRDRRLQGIEAVVQRQQCMLAEATMIASSLDHSTCRVRRFRPHRGIVDEGPFTPIPMAPPVFSAGR